MERITLDDTGYEELLEKAVSRIPALCPDWQNIRQSDPGITLIQLMAALTDIQNYTIDSVSEQHKEGYIRLLGGRKREIKYALANVDLGQHANGLIKGARIKIGRKAFEYFGGRTFIQKETLVKNVDFYCDGRRDTFDFSFWAACNGAVRVFKQIDEKIWTPASFTAKKMPNAASIKIEQPEKCAYRAVFCDYEYYKESDYRDSGIARPEDGVLIFGKTTGVTMQKIKIYVPASNGIMPREFKLWINYGSYYEEIGFNPIKDGFITLGNGRDFPIPKEGGDIEAFSFVLTKGATSLWPGQSVFFEGKKIKTEAIEVLSAGRNAETADEALSRINEMLTPKVCVTAADYAEKIKMICGSEIKKLKVISGGSFNKINVYAALLKDEAKMPFSKWRSGLLKKLQPYKLLTVSLEIHKVIPVSVTVEGEIALNAGDGVEVQEEIRRTIVESCESEIGSPINSHTLTEKLSTYPHVKRIYRLHVKYDGEIVDVQKAMTCSDLNNLSIKFIIS